MAAHDRHAARNTGVDQGGASPWAGNDGADALAGGLVVGRPGPEPLVATNRRRQRTEDEALDDQPHNVAKPHHLHHHHEERLGRQSHQRLRRLPADHRADRDSPLRKKHAGDRRPPRSAAPPDGPARSATRVPDVVIDRRVAARCRPGASRSAADVAVRPCTGTECAAPGSSARPGCPRR